jgi:hypothetical protein
MALLVFNITGAAVTLAAGTPAKVIPASAAPPARGAAVNVTSELRGLVAGGYIALEAQRPGVLVYEWTSDPEYATGTLTIGGPVPGLHASTHAAAGGDPLTVSTAATLTTPIAIARITSVLAPDLADIDAVHANLAGNANSVVQASQDFGLLGDFDSTLQAVPIGRLGNVVSVTVIGDSATGAGVVSNVVGNALTIHYESGVSTVALVEANLAAPPGSTLVTVSAPGTAATVLTAPADNIPLTLLSGGVDGVDFPGPFTSPDVPRNVTATFGAAYNAGDVRVYGTDQFDVVIEDSLVSNPGGITAGTKIFKTVTRAKRAAIGAAADPVSIGFGNKLGLSVVLSSVRGIGTVDGVGEAMTFDMTNNAVTPTTLPNTARNYDVIVQTTITSAQNAHAHILSS